jgi:hypothetical protein
VLSGIVLVADLCQQRLLALFLHILWFIVVFMLIGSP